MTDELDWAAGPDDEEVAAWAEAVRRRRQAWLNGPSTFEKLQWARHERRRRAARAGGYIDDEPAPSAAEAAYDLGLLGVQAGWAGLWCPLVMLAALAPPALQPRYPFPATVMPGGPARPVGEWGRPAYRAGRGRSSGIYAEP